MDKLLSRIGKWTKSVRILIILIVSLLIGMALTMVLNMIMGISAISSNLPAMIGGAAGLLAYVIGWSAMIGFNTGKPIRAGRSAIIFMGFGLSALVVLILLAIIGLIYSTT